MTARQAPVRAASQPTISDMIAEVRRELALRKAVYPGFIARGKMKQADADRSLARMQAVHGLLTKLQALEERANAGELQAGLAMSDLGFCPTPEEWR